MKRVPGRVLLFACILPAYFQTTALLAAGTADMLTLDAVITAVVTNHPDLAISDLDTAIAAIETRKLAGILDATVNASIGIRDDETPVASDFQPEATRIGQISGGISRPLASGASVNAFIDYSRTRQQFSSPLAAQLARINPTYRGSISVQYRHPLARGADRPAYREGLEAADADTAASRLRRELVARHLALATLNTFYLLLSSEVSIRLADIAVDRATRLLDYQHLREEFGLIETADRQQAEALLATRALELQEARALREQHRVALNRLMRRDPGTSVSILANDAAAAHLQSLNDVFDIAATHRPEFRILDAQLGAAMSRHRIARDGTRAQVDIVAELGSMALDRNAGDAATGTLSPNDTFAGLSLEFSERLGNRTADAEAQRALLMRQRVLLERHQLAEQVRDELATILTTLQTGAETLRLAWVKAQDEQDKFDAELGRYRDGRSDTATIIQFEGDLHGAELHAELLQLSLLLGDRQLAWSTGVLLAELGVVIPEPASASP